MALLGRGHTENWHDLPCPHLPAWNHYWDHLMHRKIDICFMSEGLSPAAHQQGQDASCPYQLLSVSHPRLPLPVPWGHDIS